MSAPGTVVAVDLGRSSARVAIGLGGRRRTHLAGAGLGDPGGTAAVAAAVWSALGDDVPDGPWTLALGVPGALTRPDVAAELADRLAARSGAATVVVTSDVVAWHAGAFAAPHDDQPQVVLAVGTGAVALGVATDATVRRVDGHGLLLGDAGGGARLGQDGLRAGLRAAEGSGPATTLETPARARLTRGRPADAAALAGFVPAVLDAAHAGDAVARTLVDDAVAALAATVAAAAGPAGTTGDTAAGTTAVAVVGGLADALGERVTAAHPGLRRHRPDGDATDGLRRLATDRTTVHEPSVVRRAPASTRTNGLAGLLTEGVRPGSEALDTLGVDALVAALVDGQAAAPAAVAAAAAPLARAAETLGAALRAGGRLVYAGAGTSGRLATQDAAELPPTFGLDPGRARALLAGGADAAGRAVEDAEDDEDAGRRDVAGADAGPGDVVVGVAASGRTPYVLGALAAARERGAATVAVVNVPGGPAAALATTAVELLTGPEVLAGSTRLAAGTAQKIALNTLTTAAMVRAGATYGPWMVGVRATNAKLRHRAERIVGDAAGVDADTARAALADAGGEVATALVALLLDTDATTARARLAAAGSVRAAVEERA